MKVLVDHHHGALLRSMHYLFKKRFNFDVYVPTGFEWLDRDGLYSNYPHRDTANQMLNSWVHDFKYKDMFLPMTSDEFINSDVDIIVSSLYENHLFFKKIIQKYNKKCKLILQVGNNVHPELIKLSEAVNLLSSAYPSYVKFNGHKVFYRQEFDESVFKPTESCNIKSVANFKNIMESDFETVLELEKRMPDWEFKCYGALNRDGNVPDIEERMSEAMNKFGFIFHVKKDDGYGHVTHNAFACGKPTIVDLKTAGVYWEGEYIRNTASFLFEKDVTVIDVNDGIDSIVDKLKFMADNYDVYKNNVIKKYKDVVNFEKEFLEIKKFIEDLR